jgi:two-component system NarL family response regulator
METILMNANVIKVLIVDDHELVRDGLTKILTCHERMEVVGQAAEGADAVRLFLQLRPDVTLLDLSMPGMSGLEAISQIKGKFPNARIIVLSSHDHQEDIYRAIQAGASGYLLKDTSRQELFAAIEAVAAGKQFFPMAVAQRLAGRITSDELTQRETEILQRIVNGKSNKEIAGELAVAEGTIKSHISNILNKLGVADRTQAATVAIRRGLIHLD